jgi:hypothetical protein
MKQIGALVKYSISTSQCKIRDVVSTRRRRPYYSNDSVKHLLAPMSNMVVLG